MYRGEYSHSIDTKGRTIVPSKLRETLGDTFVLTKGFDGCLMAYDTTEWEKFESKLNELPIINKDVRSLLRFFLGGAADVECDAQGRVVIPANLRAFAGLSKEAVFLGIGNRIEIWSKDRYEADTTSDDVDEIAAALSDLGFSI